MPRQCSCGQWPSPATRTTDNWTKSENPISNIAGGLPKTCPPPKKTIAYLHDVVEKTGSWTSARLAGEGFSRAILDAVEALTRRAGEADDDFLKRALRNSLARAVKIADLNDNLVQVLQVGGDTERQSRELAVAKRQA